MSAAAETRIGFVGAGAVAQRHAATLGGFADVRVVAVADPEAERAAALAAGRGARAFGSVAEMLGAEELDALYVCVPPFAHGPPEDAALDAGLPFFVEKPLGVDLPGAERIAARVREQGTVTAVGYHWRYLDTVERAARVLAERPARLVLGSWLDKVPPPAWWLRRDRSGGQVVEQTTHVLDVMRTLAGDVVEVHAMATRAERPDRPDADVADVSTGLLRFASGALGTVASTSLLRAKHRAGVELFADGLAIALSEEDLAVDEGAGPARRRASGDAKIRVDRDFVDAVRGGPDRIRVPYHEALLTHRVACALSVSADERRAVEVPRG
jgi:predicted dehydrogenase